MNYSRHIFGISNLYCTVKYILIKSLLPTTDVVFMTLIAALQIRTDRYCVHNMYLQNDMISQNYLINLDMYSLK